MPRRALQRYYKPSRLRDSPVRLACAQHSTLSYLRRHGSRPGLPQRRPRVVMCAVWSSAATLRRMQATTEFESRTDNIVKIRNNVISHTIRGARDHDDTRRRRRAAMS
eukprot:5914526-Pleurochrysis_carterae.AAC.1